MRLIGFLILLISNISIAQENYLATGIYLGNIEEGARIISFVRLLPKEHPQAQGHDYPTLFQFHKSEFETHLLLGEQLGWKLYATLFRHPTAPGDDWKFQEYTPINVNRIRDAKSIDKSNSLIPGIKILACLNNQPVAYIIDTRDLSLKERGMTRATSSGLDMNRDQFEQILKENCQISDEDIIVIFNND